MSHIHLVSALLNILNLNSNREIVPDTYPSQIGRHLLHCFEMYNIIRENLIARVPLDQASVIAFFASLLPHPFPKATRLKLETLALNHFVVQTFPT
jgi:hypothetical protein